MTSPRPADVLMAAHLAKLAAAERGSAEYVEHNNHAQHFADAKAHRAGMMDEICEEQTPTGYHSKDMVTLDNGADEPGTVLCGYHELRRHMARHAAERARLAAANAPCGGPGGWW